MREIRPSGSEGGVALTPPSLPLSAGRIGYRPSRTQMTLIRRIVAACLRFPGGTQICSVHAAIERPTWRSKATGGKQEKAG